MGLDARVVLDPGARLTLRFVPPEQGEAASIRVLDPGADVRLDLFNDPTTPATEVGLDIDVLTAPPPTT